MTTYSPPPPDDAPDRPYQAAPGGLALPAPATVAQTQEIVHCFQVLAWPPEQTGDWLHAGWGVRRVKLLSHAQAAAVLAALINELAAWAQADAADADFADLPPVMDPAAPVTQAQVADLEALRQQAGMNDWHLRNWLLKHWKVERLRSLNQDQYQAARELLLRRPPAPAGEGRGSA